MKCWECKHFKIQYKPIGKINTGIWDFGQAKCTKHDLIVDFPDNRKLKKLECIEEQKQEKAVSGNDNRTGMVCT